MIKPPTLQQAVEIHLRKAVLNGEIASGAEIAIDDLIDQFGVSRVPIRDALRVLEGEGLVRSQPRRGYVVTELSVQDLRDLQEIRGVLEEEALSDARRAITGETFEVMDASFASMCEAEDSGDYTAWINSHRDFHFALFILSSNRALVRMLHQLWNASDIYRAAHMASVDARAVSRHQHAEILEAVRIKDVDSLFKIMKEHRTTTVDRLETARSGISS